MKKTSKKPEYSSVEDLCVKCNITGGHGYTRKVGIIRTFLKYPYHLYAELNDDLNSFDTEEELVSYIQENNLTPRA